ncbi:MAG: 50S ribosomal protein L23 [Flavobacteriaceae bacterium]|jgi:large subunit ribosomal protein L23|nr:50S ribosomal protein L23 [Flavobacteriaceae bacterium]
MSILIKPVISEKANAEIDARNRYTFLVQPKANKSEIKYAVQQAYGVEVTAVRTSVSAPDVKVKYTKKGLQVGKSSKVKKAMVDIKEGQSIDIYGNV